jgi:hypothetical protein
VKLTAVSSNGSIKDEHVVSVDNGIEAERESESEGSSSVPLQHVQLRTRWDGSDFNTKMIQRQGEHGNILNL